MISTSWAPFETRSRCATARSRSSPIDLGDRARLVEPDAFQRAPDPGASWRRSAPGAGRRRRRDPDRGTGSTARLPRPCGSRRCAAAGSRPKHTTTGGEPQDRRGRMKDISRYGTSRTTVLAKIAQLWGRRRARSRTTGLTCDLRSARRMPPASPSSGRPCCSLQRPLPRWGEPLRAEACPCERSSCE